MGESSVILNFLFMISLIHSQTPKKNYHEFSLKGLYMLFLKLPFVPTPCNRLKSTPVLGENMCLIMAEAEKLFNIIC